MTIGAGARRAYVTLVSVAAVTPTAGGGYSPDPVPLDPPDAWAAIAPATARQLERIFGGTVTATATSLVTMPYHPGVTTQTIITYRGRLLSVLGVANPDERDIETVCACAEVVP